MQDNVRQRPWRAFDLVNHWGKKNNRSEFVPFDTEPKPAGGNISFGDGHVEWRNFLEMKERYDLNNVGYYWY